MKKIIIFILTVTLAFVMSTASFATNKIYTYEYDDVTVVFEETTQFTEEQRERISDILVNGNANSTATYGLWCTLFGHNYVEDTVTTITHCVRDTAPRCLREIFTVGECSRCGETYSNLNSSNYIYCCS